MTQTQTDPRTYIEKTARESSEIRERFIADHAQDLIDCARQMGECLQNGGKIILMGNGGSAADAQHTAAELVGRMLIERGPLAAIALNTDTSNLTAIGNDYGYQYVFSRQIEAIARPDDFVIAISTSGNSKNILLAVESAKTRGCFVLGLTGGSGGELVKVCDRVLNAKLGQNSSRIQETHIFALHSLVDLMDRFFLKKN